MPKAKRRQPAYLKEVKKLIDEAMESMLTKIQKLLRDELREEMLLRLDEIHSEMIKLKYELRMNNQLYYFWAQKHLSPSLKEEFLQFQQKLEEGKMVKRVD